MAAISNINGLAIKDETARAAHDSLASAVENLANELDVAFQSIDQELDETVKQVKMGGVSYAPSDDGIIQLPGYLVEGETSSTAIILSSSGWIDNTQTINNVKGVSANNNIFVAPAGNPKAYADAGIYCSAQGTNSLTFVCETIPTANITVNVGVSTDGVGGWEYVGSQASTDGLTGVVSLTGPGDFSGDSYLLLVRYCVADGQGNQHPITALLVRSGDDSMRCETRYSYYESSTWRTYTSVIERTSRGIVITNYNSSNTDIGGYAYNIKVFKHPLPATT